MNMQIIGKKILTICFISLLSPLIFIMCILSSIFFKTYIKTLFYFLSISHFFNLSEGNLYQITILLLLIGLCIFALIRHNINDSFLSFLIFIASYGIYGYLFATIHALGFFTKPLLPALMLIAFLGFVPILQKIKAVLDIRRITPGVQNIAECSLWTIIFLVSSKIFYPNFRPDLINFFPFTLTQRWYGLSEAAIFFFFFSICLCALTSLVILQSKKLYTLFNRE
jgi:hypothetical protein